MNDIGAVVERLLSKRVASIEPIDEHGWKRDHVFRAGLADGSTAIVKTGKRWEGQLEYPPMGFWGDWAGVRFLTELDAGVAPRFLGGDREAAMYVLEDVGDGPSLADSLLANDPAAAGTALVGLASSLARMHAATIRQRPLFEQIRTSLGGFEPFSSANDTSRDARTFAGICAELAAWSRACDDERETVVRAIAEPGPFLAYVHDDACPDNCRIVADRVLLFDFELGHYGHVLTDAAYARMGFPTCWCVARMDPPEVDAFDGAYRAVIAAVCPEAADDDVFAREMTIACAAWMFETVATYMPRIDSAARDWERMATRKQRILLRLDAFARIARTGGTALALGDVAAQLHARLWESWPDARDLPLYPAFRRETGVIG